MLAGVNTQEPSKLKKVLLAPVRWLIMGLFIVLAIIVVISVLILSLIFKALFKLYFLAGGEVPQWLEQRAEVFREVARVPQTTHDTDVNDAVSINIQRLRKNYGEPGVEDGFIQEIENFINALECTENGTQKDVNKYQLTNDEKKHALECLERIKNNPDIHSGSRLTLKQVLNLVWKACNDKNKKDADFGIDIDTRILQRRYQLVRHLIESQTEYGVHGSRGAIACFTGTFNSIISSLYIFEEFPFLQRVDKDTIKQKFESELQKKGEVLFKQLPDDKAKKEVVEALSNPSTDFFLSYIESFKDHPARAVLGDEECNKLIKDHFNNLQYNGTISSFAQTITSPAVK
ncbi:hypothetical protein [Candidatus Wolbachia massiliensis]|uniref:Membrane protein WF-2 n=1 Tax=Candidatus Wolbachia massiliensis TaxID=1845000 RepID=A0A7L7YQJ2_9RICK|nr:hypothetical protein [Candidatus Wolbachia massiliensis]QOD38046.1 hypothetical protein ID128_04410 [Candidatus Wolbachia massiliensis]